MQFGTALVSIVDIIITVLSLLIYDPIIVCEDWITYTNNNNFEYIYIIWNFKYTIISEWFKLTSFRLCYKIMAAVNSTPLFITYQTTFLRLAPCLRYFICLCETNMSLLLCVSISIYLAACYACVVHIWTCLNIWICNFMVVTA